MCNSVLSHYARGMRLPPAVTAMGFLVASPIELETISAFLRIGAVFVILWGVLLLGILGPSPLGFGLAGQLVHYGLSIRRRDIVAVSMGWSTTTAMGVVTMLMGVTPVMLAVWIAFLFLSLFLTLFLNRAQGGMGVKRSLQLDPRLPHEMTPRRTA